MVTISLLAQPLLDFSQFSFTPFVIPVHHFATKDSPDTQGQTSGHQYLKLINYVFPVPPLKFPQRLMSYTLFGSLAQRKGSREHSGQTLSLCKYSHLPSFLQRQLSTPLDLLAFWHKSSNSS